MEININILKQVGLQVAQETCCNDFKASNEWVNRFRVRHGLKFKFIHGEEKSSDTSVIKFRKHC